MFLNQNVKAIETLIENDKTALNSFRQKHWLPLETFTSIPEAEKGEKPEKPFLKCSFNGEGKNAFRSPWTNRYYMMRTSDTGIDIDIYEKPVPPQEQDIRDMEGAANEVWEAYMHLYYGRDAIGSVYLKPSRDKFSFEGFFGVSKKTPDDGTWNSVHLVQVEEPNEEEATCTYRVESAVVMSLCPYEKATVSSSLTKETVKTLNIRFSGVSSSHLENIGTILEQVEIDFRSRMERVDIPKSMEVVESIYRKQMVGSTVHLIRERTSMSVSNATGGLVGDIASMALKKREAGGGENAFLAAAQRTEKEREAKEKAAAASQEDTSKNLLEFKSNLKSAAPKPKPHADSTPTPEFMNFRSKLKKTGK